MRTPTLLLLGLAVGCALSSECHAVNVVLLPHIPVMPSKLGIGSGLAGKAVGTSLYGSVTIIDPVPNPGVQTKLDGYETPLGFSYGDSERESSDGRAVAIGTTTGFVNSMASASPGRLRGKAVAGGGGGSVNGVATATAMFVDTVTLVTGDEYAIDWDVKGSISGGTGVLTPAVRTPFAGGTVRAQVWWVPFEVNLAQASQSSFFGSLYQSTTWVFNPTTGKTLVTDQSIKPDLGSLADLREPAGTKYWVVGLLEITAGRSDGGSGTVYPSSSLTGTVDFSHTVNLTIESLRFPGQSGVTSLSGHDYAPSAVPEPASSWLLLGGLAMLIRRGMGSRPYRRPIGCRGDGREGRLLGSTNAG